MTSSTAGSSPLHGVVVVDVSRMLPGAVLARAFIELGARWIKVEDPRHGDPMRSIPPFDDGIGTGFTAHFAGAQSVGLDLRTPEGSRALRDLVAHADVFVESFRPGTLTRWGLDPDSLREAHPRLVGCSLPGFARDATTSTAVGHDLNFVANWGLLDRMRSTGVPAIQLADVSTGMLATSALLAALFERERTGQGRWIEQPLAAGPMPFVWWAWQDLMASDQIGATEHLIGGALPAYHVYRCRDDRSLAVGCLEAKFWVAFCEAVGRPELAPGATLGPDARRIRAQMAEHLAGHDASHWMERVAGLDLPVTVVKTLQESRRAPEELGVPMESSADGPRLGAVLPSLGRRATGAVPRLGEHTEAVLAWVRTRASDAPPS